MSKANLFTLGAHLRHRLIQRIAKFTVGSLISTLFITSAGIGVGLVTAPAANAASYTSCYANGDDTTPTKPTITNVSYTYSNGANVDVVTITFTPPINNGSGGAPTQYWYSTDGESTWAQAIWTSPNTTLTFTQKSSNGAITRKGTYGFGIVARNSAGNYGCSSGSLTAVAGTPSAPTNVTGTKGNAQVSLSWTAPSSTGGAAITDYEYQYSTDGGSNWSSTSTVGSATTSATISSLTNGTSYVFRVAAVNSQGTGVHSQQSSAVIPSTTPSNPTGLGATVESGQSTISWTAGANGGASIDSFTVVASPGGSSCTTPNGSTYSCTVTGLTNGTLYTFTVKAWNINGASSGVTTTVTPAANTTSTLSGLSASVGAFNESFVSSTYSYSKSVANTSTSTTITATWTGAGETATITANGTTSVLTSGSATSSISLSVGANTITVIGYAQSGATSTYTITITRAGQVPDAPTIGTATAYDETATVTWSFSGSNGGYTIDSFTVTSNPGSLKCYGTGASATSCTVSGLTNGTAYTFTVVANNSVGSSSASSASSPAVTPAAPPDLPDSIDGSAGTLTLNISWAAPTRTNGSALQGYYIEISSDSGANWNQVNSSSTTSVATTATISGLSGDSTYLFRVSAINGKGRGNPKAIVTGVKPNKNSQIISWGAGFPTTMVYNETSTVSITSSGSGSATYTVSGNCSISEANKIYATAVGDCVVVSTSAATSSYTSVTETKTVTIDAGIPDAPTVSTPTSGNGTISISASAANNAGGVSLSHFKYEYKLSSATDVDANWTLVSDTVTVTAGNSASKTISGLINGTTYDIRVTAVNSRSKNSSSVKKSSITPSTTPDAPSTPSVEVYVDTATVSWSPPGNNGGASIDSYTVMMKTNSGAFVVIASGINGTTYTATGLTSANEYEFLVYASNLRGKGTNSDSSGKVQPGRLNQTISLSAANRLNYAEETTPTYSSDAGDAGGSLTLASTTPDYCEIDSGKIKAIKSGPCTVTVSTPGNGSYNSSSKSKTITIDPIEPDDPDTSTVTTTSSSIVVNWNTLATTKDGGNGGSGVQGYILEYSTNSGSSWIAVVETQTVLTGTISSLSPDTSYLIRLKAVNNGNKSSAGRSFTAKTNAATKSARSLALSGGSGINFGQSLTLSKTGTDSGTTRWTTNDSSICTVDSTGIVTSVGAGSCTVSFIADEDATYQSETATSTFTISAVDPSAPTLSEPSAGEESITLSWTAPTSKGGAASITGYTVTSSPAGFGCTTTGATSCTITGLNSSTTYTFTITATSSSGKTSVVSGSKSGKPNAKTVPSSSSSLAPIREVAPVVESPKENKEPEKAAPKSNEILPAVKLPNTNALPPATALPSKGNIVTLKNGKEEIATLTIIQEPVTSSNTQAATPESTLKTTAEIKGNDWGISVQSTVAAAPNPDGGGNTPSNPSNGGGTQLTFDKGYTAQTQGNGFAPRTTVAVYIFSDPILIGKIRTDSNGNFRGRILVPRYLQDGIHTLQLNGTTKNLEVRTASIPVVVRTKYSATRKTTPVAPAPAPAAPEKIIEVPKTVQSLSTSVNFGMSGWWINSKGYDALRKIINQLPPSAQEISVTVVGNAQLTKVNPYPNIGLDRAKAVAKAMQKLGFKAKYSVSQSNEPGLTTAAYRRADITISWKE